jgi:hypothetical protein
MRLPFSITRSATIVPINSPPSVAVTVPFGAMT